MSLGGGDGVNFTKNKKTKQKCEHDGGEKIERERETMKEKREKDERGWQGEVVKQYNIRQALEHNNTERDKY